MSGMVIGIVIVVVLAVVGFLLYYYRDKVFPKKGDDKKADAPVSNTATATTATTVTTANTATTATTSAYTTPQLSVIDLVEFNWLPTEIKNSYKSNVVERIIPRLQTKVNQQWTGMSSATRSSVLASYDTGTTSLLRNIDNMPINIRELSMSPLTVS